MAVAGFNFETLTLLALALAIGIIVDDAIVEVENIMRHIEEGESPKEAAFSATREIGLTASISTLTIVAVFLPIGLMGGTLGTVFSSLRHYYLCCGINFFIGSQNLSSRISCLLAI